MAHRIRRFLFLGVLAVVGYWGGTAAWAIDITAVKPAALGQPCINAALRRTPNGTPLSYDLGLGITIDSIYAYLDTGASGILISPDYAEMLGVQLAKYPDSTGSTVVFHDVGVAGSDDFNVSEPLYVSLANDVFSLDDNYTPTYNQTIGPVRLQVGPLGGDPQDPFGLGDLNVVGIPAMQGKVVVMNPVGLEDNGLVLPTFVYNPGTPFKAATADTDPGIPVTNRHLRLSYGSFDRFTTITPDNATGPTLCSNPFIGPDPVAKLDGVGHDTTPGVTIGFAGAHSTGSFLFDTGAAASIISTALAGNVHVRYAAGTEGTDNPQLEQFDPAHPERPGTPIANQFKMEIGGIGGTSVLAGFYLDSMLLRTMEGDPGNDADPNHLLFHGAPVLVGDITLQDPATQKTLTLDGVFGMNYTAASGVLNMGDLWYSNETSGNFNWVVFDQANGILGLDVKSGVPLRYAVWSGGATGDPHWSNATNWEDGAPNPADGVRFAQPSVAGTANFNDFPAGTQFGGIVFSGSSAFNLQGNSIVLKGNVINISTQTQTIGLNMELGEGAHDFNADSGDMVVSGRISGNQGLMKSGSEMLILRGANTYTGLTDVRQGALVLDGGDLADTATVSVAEGALFRVVSGTPRLGAIVGQGTTEVSGNGTTLTVGSITQNTLIIGAHYAVWSGGGTPDPHWSNAANWAAGAISPGDGVQFARPTVAGTANFNDFPAGTQFSGIVFSGATAFNLQGNAIVLQGNVSNGSSQTQTIGLDMELNGASRTFSADSGDIVVSGRISGNQGLVKTGEEALILRGANTYTGLTDVRQGALVLDGGDLGDTATVSVAGGALFQVDSGTPQLGAIIGQGTTEVVGEGTALTVGSIAQNTLVIGGSSTRAGASSVPEPATIWLLAAVAICLGGCVWRRKKGLERF
jgi:autotransporter-associated beta strand protein